jgi:hypothetical protein
MRSGGKVQRNVERISPGRGPGMLPGMIPDIVVHAVIVHGPRAELAARELVERLGTGTGWQEAGCYTAAWTVRMHRDGVLLPLPRGALPAIVEGVRAMATAFPISVMLVGGMAILGGVDPAMVRPVLEGTTAEQWLGNMHLPVRMLYEPDDPDHGGDGRRHQQEGREQSLQAE